VAIRTMARNPASPAALAARAQQGAFKAAAAADQAQALAQGLDSPRPASGRQGRRQQQQHQGKNQAHQVELIGTQFGRLRGRGGKFSQPTHRAAGTYGRVPSPVGEPRLGIRARGAGCTSVLRGSIVL